MYTILDTKKVNELFLLRCGWFNPEYELTDKVYSYGKLSYSGLSRRKAIAVSAIGTWIFKCEGLFNRTILITDENGKYIGKSTRDWFSCKRLLMLQTGFQAEFYRPLIWSREYIWNSEGYGKIMHINTQLLGLKNTIYIDQSMAPQALMPLLIFFGGHLTILRRRRRAAHY